MDSKKLNSLWVERYRPKTLDEMCLREDIKTRILSWGNEIPHLLMAGSVGIGKTSTAKILVNDILKCDYLYINASDENGIDTIRNKVTGFIQTKSLDGQLKVVLLDECLEENTLVHVLRNGEYVKIPIKELKSETDLVKSYSISKNRIEYRPFEMRCNGEKEVYEIELSNGEKVVCTDTHKWYVDVEGTPTKMTLKDIMKKGITEILSV